ncbi:MAG TPA: hypothetical protein VHU91_04405 [Mycobacteriales bacterium]|jgi:hypothetical protein|nr:hypothetical protein [Mycobacteriales bacterium]
MSTTSHADGSIVLIPAAPLVPHGQQWFWTSEWQAKEADADIKAGRKIVYHSDEEFLAALRQGHWT